MLVVELDGGQHGEQVEYDATRSGYLNGLGFKVLRFWNNDVLMETESVLESIRLELCKFPLPQGEGQGEGINNQQ
jgi:very-short-patch-repair endonuclease